MKNVNSNGSAAPGADQLEMSGAVNAPEADPANLKNIEKWLTDDLIRSVTLLNAILQDKEMRMQMAIWFEGRISNAKHKADPVEIPKPKKV